MLKINVNKGILYKGYNKKKSKKIKSADSLKKQQKIRQSKSQRI